MKVLAALVVGALLTLYGGFALQQLWGWFVVPQFGAAALSLPVACGLRLLVGFATYQTVPRDKDDDDLPFVERLAKGTVVALTLTSLTLASGLALHWWAS